MRIIFEDHNESWNDVNKKVLFETENGIIPRENETLTNKGSLYQVFRVCYNYDESKLKSIVVSLIRL